jgi:hypothetical protein
MADVPPFLSSQGLFFHRAGCGKPLSHKLVREQGERLNWKRPHTVDGVRIVPAMDF